MKNQLLVFVVGLVASALSFAAQATEEHYQVTAHQHCLFMSCVGGENKDGNDEVVITRQTDDNGNIEILLSLPRKSQVLLKTFSRHQEVSPGTTGTDIVEDAELSTNSEGFKYHLSHQSKFVFANGSVREDQNSSIDYEFSQDGDQFILKSDSSISMFGSETYTYTLRKK